VRPARTAFIALALICSLAASWGIQGLWRKSSHQSSPTTVEALVDRCNVHMLKDTCRVMSSPSSMQSSKRMFIAGVGEVDASAFESMRSYGDKMCQAVGAECAAEWDGRSCRIARALYPLATN
jgi:hypothetical protein